MAEGALNGIRVLDLSRVLAGPYCTMILGDLGAEIIKVEAPGGSDDTRDWGPPFKNNESAYYLCANRNKKAMTVNLKSERGKEIIHKLIESSDVLIHNFKPGTMERLGLAYEEVKRLNPKLVYCSISGFGQTGPHRELAGYDFVIQAMSGLMSITGSEASGSMKVGVAITDILTGLYANIAIQAALRERDQSGQGQSIDVSLYDSAISALINVASNYLMSGDVPQPLGNQHPNIVPYQPFRAKDKDIVIAVGNNRQFRNLCRIIGEESLADDSRYQDNQARLKNKDSLLQKLNNCLKTEKSDYWIGLFHEHGIPCGPIQKMDEVFNDPHVRAREMLVNMEHPSAGEISMIGSPLKLLRTPPVYEKHPPKIGEHTEEILKSLGYTSEEVQSLSEDQSI